MKKKLALLFLMTSSVCFGQNLKISQLPVATTPLAGTELIPIVQNGITKQTTIGAIGVSAPCCGLITGNPAVNGNFFVGTLVGNPTLTGGNNVITGYGSGEALTTGSFNVVYGNGAFNANTIGYSNVVLGPAVLASNVSGSLNVAVGSAALGSNITGSSLTAIGAQTDVATDGLSNSIALGSGAVITASNQLVVGSTSIPVSSWVINNVPYIMPSAQGATATVLTNNGSGTLSWSTPPSGGITSIGIGNFGDAMGFSPNPLTSNGNINILWLGTSSELVNGIGNVVPIPGGGFSNFVDTMYRTRGKDSIQFKINGRYHAILDSAVSGGGTGTVTSFSVGTLSPLFTTSVATATSTPALSFSLSNTAIGYSFFGDSSGTVAAPYYYRNLNIKNFNNGSGASSSTFWRGDGTWATPGTSPSLTSTYIGYGNGSNVLTGDANFTRNAQGIGLQDFNSGNANIYIGTVALPSGNNSGTGTSNVGLGSEALNRITDGFYNIAMGKNALFSNTSGSNNVAVGFNCLNSNSTGNNLIALGSEIDVSTDGLSNSVGIGSFDGFAPLITESNEFVVASGIINWNIGGVAYVLPTSQGAASTVLTNDGSGNLSWASAGGSPSLTSSYIGYGNGSNTLTGNSNFTYDGTHRLTLIGETDDTLLYIVGGGGRDIINDLLLRIGNVKYQFPSSQGSSSTVLTNDGGGNLSWATVSGIPITLTTTGTSGAATLSSGVLNIPQYSGNGNNITLLESLTGADLNYSGDQSITLNGGTNYVITNVVYTNVSADLTASGILQTQINTGASLSGNYIEYENEFIALMSNSSQFMDWNVAGSISAIEHIQPYAWIQPSSSIMGYTVTSPIYFSDLVLNGSSATCDIYVYGYILN